MKVIKRSKLKSKSVCVRRFPCLYITRLYYEPTPNQKVLCNRTKQKDMLLLIWNSILKFWMSSFTSYSDDENKRWMWLLLLWTSFFTKYFRFIHNSLIKRLTNINQRRKYSGNTRKIKQIPIPWKKSKY